MAAAPTTAVYPCGGGSTWQACSRKNLVSFLHRERGRERESEGRATGNGQRYTTTHCRNDACAVSHQMVVGRVRQCTHNRNTVQHSMALTNATLGLSFPFCSGIRQSTRAGCHKTRHNVPAAASAAPPARHKSVHQHEGRGQPTWQTNRDCT